MEANYEETKIPIGQLLLGGILCVPMGGVAIGLEQLLGAE